MEVRFTVVVCRRDGHFDRACALLAPFANPDYIHSLYLLLDGIGAVPLGSLYEATGEVSPHKIGPGSWIDNYGDFSVSQLCRRMQVCKFCRAG